MNLRIFLRNFYAHPGRGDGRPGTVHDPRSTVHDPRSGERLRWVKMTLLYIASRIFLAAVGLFALGHIGVQGYNYNHNLHLENNTSPLVESLYRWDAVWYLSIAREGYTTQEDNPHYAKWKDAPFASGFFPLLPLLIRALHCVIPNWEICGLLLSFLLGLCLFLLFYGEVKARVGEEVAWRATLFLLLFPSSIFLSLPFAESLLFIGFLALARGFRLKEWEWIILGALITVTAKPIGLFLPFAILLARGISLRARIQALSAWLVGAIAVAATFWAALGTPVAPLVRQGLMRGLPSGPWRAFVLFLVSEKHLFGWNGSWIDLAWAILFLGFLFAATRRRLFSPFALVWSWILLLLPLCSSLISFQRLSVVIFPAIAEGGILAKRRAFLYPLLAALFLLQLYWSVRYATFQWTG